MQDTIEFLQNVLPAVGQYCHAVKIHRRNGFIHKFVNTVDELAQLQLQESGPGRDVYFALAAFGQGVNKHGVQAREATNAHTLRSLWIDIDCGPGKPYATIDDGLAALDQFLDGGFPDYTYLVKSGHGAHAYWVLDADAPRGEWQPVAAAFQAAWQAAGLDTDPITADSARVLRTPGTWNRKREPAVLVEVMENTGHRYTLAQMLEGAQKFAAALPATSTVLRVAAQKLDTVNDDLLAGLPERKSYLSAIAKRCKQVRDIARTRGAECAEPLWYATVQLARHLDNGPEVAQYLSAGHPGYDPGAVVAKLEQLAAKDIGPTTCERFQSLNPKGCEGCKWKVTSPVQLGEKDPEHEKPVIAVKVVEIDDDGQSREVDKEIAPPVEYPQGFMFTEGRTVAQLVDDKGVPTWRPIFNGAIFPTRVYRAHGRPLEMEIYTQRAGTGETRVFSLPAAKVGEAREVRTELLANVMIDGAAAPLLQKYLNAMAMKIQDATATDLSVRQLGWQMGDPRAKSHFIWGRTRITPDGAVRGIVVDDALAKTYDRLCLPDGSLEGALAGADLFNRPGGQMHQAIYLTGLSGVFAPFTGAQNFAVLSLMNRVGGEGKTTMCDAAMSHWFNPTLVRNTTRDTSNALFNTMSTRGTLPVFIDEVTNAAPHTLVDLIYNASQGQEKARMDQGGYSTREPLPPWKCPVILTANTSVRQVVRAQRGDAAALDARVVEIKFTRLDLGPAEAKVINNVFYQNYGWTGPAIAQHVAKNMPAYAQTADLLRDKLIEACGRDQSDRFWLNWAVSVLLACRAMRKLGWAEYSLDELFRYLVSLLQEQRVAKALEMRSCSDILGEFLADNASRIIVADRRNGREGVRKLVTVLDAARAQPLVGRSQIDEQALYLAASPLRDYCQSKGYDFGSFISESMAFGLIAKAVQVGGTDAEPEWGPAPDRYSLGRGLPVATAPVRVVAFNLNHETLRYHLEDARNVSGSHPGNAALTGAR